MDNNLEVKKSSAASESHPAERHSAEHHSSEPAHQAHPSGSEQAPSASFSENAPVKSEQTPSASSGQVANNNKKKAIILKLAIIIACVIVVGALIFTYKDLFIAATVNGSPISRLAVIHELESRSGKSVLDNIIVEKIVDNEARKKEIRVSDDEVNAEINNLEQQIKAQGGTLDQMLAFQGMTLNILKNQILIQKKLEKLLADKIQVSDAEVEKYIKDNKVVIPKGEDAAYKDQITEQLKQQKLSTEANSFIGSLKSQAVIRYFVNY